MKILDEALLDEFRAAPWCEWCGRPSPGRLDPHHVWAKGMGGGGQLDHRWNLFSMCRLCHDRAGNPASKNGIPRWKILILIAIRERTTPEAIEAEINRIKALDREGKEVKRGR